MPWKHGKETNFQTFMNVNERWTIGMNRALQCEGSGSQRNPTRLPHFGEWNKWLLRGESGPHHWVNKFFRLFEPHSSNGNDGDLAEKGRTDWIAVDLAGTCESAGQESLQISSQCILHWGTAEQRGNCVTSPPKKSTSAGSWVVQKIGIPREGIVFGRFFTLFNCWLFSFGKRGGFVGSKRLTPSPM